MKTILTDKQRKFLTTVLRSNLSKTLPRDLNGNPLLLSRINNMSSSTNRLIKEGRCWEYKDIVRFIKIILSENCYKRPLDSNYLNNLRYVWLYKTPQE